MVAVHPHAAARLAERGASEEEVVVTVERGLQSPAKFGRVKFVFDFDGDHIWRGRNFDRKRVEAYAVFENDDWLVITVIVKFGRAT